MVNETEAEPLLNALPDGEFVAVGADIVSGTVVGVTEELAELFAELPLSLFALTVSV